MRSQGVNILKRLLYPVRKMLGRIAIDDTTTIFYKAGRFMAADKIAGDYLEFGVFSGTSFAAAFHAIQEAYHQSSAPSEWNTDQDCAERRTLATKMRFFAFDSFQGLPEPTGVDRVSRDFVKGKFANSEEKFKKYISSMGVPLEYVTIVSGWYNDTLNEETIEKYGLQHAAIVHIDVDLFESARLVLEFVTPLLVDGTVIIFDDWYTFRGDPNLGEQRAFREWLDASPEWTATQYQKEGAWRNSFILNRKVEWG